MNDCDSCSMAMPKKWDFKWGEGSEVADGGVGAIDYEGVCFGNPVIRQRSRGFDVGLKCDREGFFKVVESLGGEFKAVDGSEDESAKKSLIGGVWGVAAEDVGKRARGARADVCYWWLLWRLCRADVGYQRRRPF